MVDFKRLKTTLVYARLGLVSLATAVVPIAGAAQDLCAVDLLEGEPDAAALLDQTFTFLDVLEDGGVVAFEGREGRMTIDAARRALREGAGSASLLACVVNAETVEFLGETGERVVACDVSGRASLLGSGSQGSGLASGQLFCTSEIATISQYLGSES